MAEIKITRKIDIEVLRSLCIRYNLYRKGTNEQYSEMFAIAKGARTDAGFLRVAQNIWEHSCTDDLITADFGYETLCWYIFNDCVRTYINAEE